MEDQNIIYGGDLEGSEAISFASLGEMIIENLKKHGDKRNFIDGTTGKTQSHKEILDQSIKVAKALHNKGIKENDAVAIISENRHDFIPIVFGTWYLNAVSSPINVTYTERELKHALQLSKPKVIFASSFAIKTVISACKELQFVKYLILLDGQSLSENYISYQEFINAQSDSFDVYQHVKRKVNTKDQTTVIFLSSGTTGLPKGVEITQRNIMEVMQGYSDGIEEYRKVAGRLAGLAIAPWFHVLGLMNVVVTILVGESLLVFLPKFDPELYLKSIEKYAITVLIVAPPIVVFLAKTPLFNKYDLSSLRAIYCGAAPLSSQTEEELKSRFKTTKVLIIQGYGMSETTYGIIGSPTETKSGSIGHILKGNYVKVIDENGIPLGPNQRGELCFKGSRVMKGYLNNPKATAETIDKDGWLHTGDIGYYDEDKQFYIVDRLKELIKYKAYQVAPAELEGLLLSNPKIKDAGVIGIPDETSGELPFAFVVKQPGANLTEQEVKDFVAKNASNAKWLRGGVKFVDEIPKNPSGKILRRELRELYSNTRSKL
ncbi:luciferin 4-monooxygenase-like [Chironomus tepperi]|uniref:luciferin 4-monooxygenase-like n=1 Tax=Chironomus tepperi TaxID=113505 RepID=UPI00391F0CCC